MTEVENLLDRLEALNQVGSALSNERDLDRLLEKILLAAKSITHADGGTLYLATPDGRRLRFAIVRTDSLGIAFGGPHGQTLDDRFKDLDLFEPDGHCNHKMVATYAAHTGKTVNIPDAYTAQGFDFSGTRAFDAATGYRSRSFLTVPMKNHEGDLVGVLQLLNALPPGAGQVTEFSDADQRLAESLASQAAVALTNRQLIVQLEQLFESFVKLINVAIDEKSPYTGGHCERVPVLTMMLAHAVNETQEGPLADVRLTDKDFYELSIAALLHDCGKVSTPVHVVDKATKLETIFDRIHLLDAKFEAARRQQEAVMWRAVAEGTLVREVALADWQAWCAQMEDDRALVRRINAGAERVADADLARVRAIAAQYRWTNPAGQDEPLISPNELENLSIRAGTLTPAERDIVNHHIVATIKMLEQLPWPKNLRNVPEYAGGHHERMDGQGYPKGLKRDEMSWQARMMGIADIFEALTASDRPYKAPMKLSEALQIMDKFKANGHIDPDLYDVFVGKQVYKSYAAQFLEADQIDL
ncbi:MAG: GAF domain-containing protein [Burkholderiaceae bacterium]|nr:GAF domain-containing protein [Burkholderiaceae bacterium]